MIQTFSRFLIILMGCSLLYGCGDDQRRIDGELAFNSGSLMNMAESFLQAGDYGNALRLFQRAANENPTHVASRLGLAKTYQALGATDAAINFYDQVLALDPLNNEAKLGTGQMLITKNRPDDAIPFLTDLSKQDPNNYKIFNMLGLAYDLKGEQETAQLNYGQGLKLAPDNISVLNNLALSFAFEGQYPTSIQLLSKAINLDYSVTKAHQNLVLVYVLSGEEEAGRQIGASLMTAEEMENNIRHYKWVETLTPAHRAQAIFLGIRSFPKDSEQTRTGQVQQNSRDGVDAVPLDPKKRQLMEVLKQENHIEQQQEPVVKNETPDHDRKRTVTDDPVSVAVTSLPETIYRVQLGSYPNTDIAHQGWKKLKKRSNDILAAYEPLIKLVTLANNKTLFRLYIGGIEDKAIAQTICQDLQEINIDCLVLKTIRE